MTEAKPNAHASTSIEGLVRCLVAAAEDRKAIDLRVLDLRGLTSFTDYFVIASGATERQVEAIANGITESLRAAGRRPGHVEGLASAQWVLMDYGDFVAHVFLEDRRRFYGLDRLWGDAPEVKAEIMG